MGDLYMDTESVVATPFRTSTSQTRAKPYSDIDISEIISSSINHPINLQSSFGRVVVSRCPEDQFPLTYALTLPVSIDTLNKFLELSGSDILRNGEELYLPPIKLIDFIDPNALNAAAIFIEQLDPKRTQVSFENKGHFVGLFRFYFKNVK
jgi:hypothetical protein